MFQRTLLGSRMWAKLHRQAPLALGSGFGTPIHGVSQFPQNARAFSGLTLIRSSIFGTMGTRLDSPSISTNLSSTHALNFKSSIHFGKPAEDVAGRTTTPLRSMDYVKGLLNDRLNNDSNPRGLPHQPPPRADSFRGKLQERGGNNSFNGRAPLYQQPQLEANADVVHIKLMRNNSFVTVTDSKGNKKFGVTAGQLAGKGGKLGRYSGEAAAENVGRRVRQMKTRSVVVKVNGFTFFRRKKDAILSFRDGYSNSRSDVNPVVYLEDTTRGGDFPVRSSHSSRHGVSPVTGGPGGSRGCSDVYSASCGRRRFPSLRWANGLRLTPSSPLDPTASWCWGVGEGVVGRRRWWSTSVARFGVGGLARCWALGVVRVGSGDWKFSVCCGRLRRALFLFSFSFCLCVLFSVSGLFCIFVVVLLCSPVGRVLFSCWELYSCCAVGEQRELVYLLIGYIRIGLLDLVV
ncbi:30S ribosomal protein S11 [Striga asiatica]|uniref:30S ribosomal protein S11 n=1 Tax=Striga asiatica TaxID=4170 RepID=A0A5A7RK99_STRAF|nr:30S ribosomal protein S11 [Striga asiatica]